MTKHRDLAYGQALPEAVMDAMMELLGTYVSGNFAVTQVNATTLRVPASAGNGQVGISIGGAWRYNVANADAVAPAGGAATYTLWVTGSANSFGGGPPEVDSTTYAFGLEIRTSGSPAAALSRQIGTVDWNGTAIRGVLLSVAAVDDRIPAGFLFESASAVVPTNYLLCDGSAVSRATYARLFASISTVWGVGDGSTTFNLPDLRGKTTIGSGTGSGLTARTLGQVGGGETVALAIGEMPAHDHGAVTGGTTPTGTVSTVTSTGTVGSTTDTGTIGAASPTGVTDSQGSHTHTGTFVANLQAALTMTDGVGTGDTASRFRAEKTSGGSIGLKAYDGPNANASGTTAASGVHAHNVTTTAHAHTVTMNAHTHTLTMDSHAHTFTGNSHTHTVASQGSGTGHNNMPPFAVVTRLIRT